MAAKKNILLLIAGMALTGCSLAPDFLLPDTPSPEAFKEASAASAAEGSWKVGEPSAQLDRGQWWKVFGDERLDKLQEQAIRENLSIQAMAARVKQARATATIASASFFPSLGLNAGAVRQKLGAQTMGLPGGAATSPQNQIDLGIGLSYELDFFGRVLNSSRAAKQDALAMEEMLHSMVLTMQADVAEMYFSLCQLSDEKSLLTDAVHLREESLGILQKRLNAGIITELDTSQAVVELESARAQLHAVSQQYKETEHALAVLLGQAPADFFLDGVTLTNDIPDVPVGLPSQLLERRPDITAAQHDLAAANARIGIARAAFFPSVSLTGTGGFQSSSLRDIFDWSGRTWSVGPLASLPLFRGGVLKANSERSKAAYDEAVADYRQIVLNAFKDVEDSLSRLKSLSDQAASQQVAETAAVRAEELAQKRYDSGVVGYLEAITARKNALDVQRYGIQIQGARLKSTVRMIRAIGGGWNGMPAKRE